jgi:hypothetical protein
MQSNINNAFGKAKRRKEAIDTEATKLLQIKLSETPNLKNLASFPS